MRTLFALMLGLGLVAAMPAGDAAAKAGKNKLCKATTLTGQKTSFKCKSGETCCFDYGMNKGSCKPKGQLCIM